MADLLEIRVCEFSPFLTLFLTLTPLCDSFWSRFCSKEHGPEMSDVSLRFLYFSFLVLTVTQGYDKMCECRN